MGRAFSYGSDRWRIALVVVVALAPATVAHATKFWRNGVTTGNWNTATNWSSISASDTTTSGVPAASEQVNIVNSDGVAHTVNLDVNTPSLGLTTINQTGGTAVNTLSITSNNTFTSGALFVAGWTGGTGGTTTSGRGAVSQSNGGLTMASGSDLVVGYGAGSVGTYTLSGTGAVTASQSEFIGSLGNGTFTQSAGTNTLLPSAVGYLDMGTSAGATGTYNLSGGSLVANKNEVVGDAGTGIFNQTGGTNTIQGAGFDLQLGNQATGNGMYTISGGTLTVGNNAAVGVSGTGTMTIQNTGSVYITNILSINSTSTVNLNGGTLRFNDVSGINRLVFNSGSVQLAGLRTIGSSSIVSTLFGSSIPVNKGLTVEGNTFISSTSGTLYSFFVDGSLTSLSTLQVGGAGDGNLVADGGHIASQYGIVGPNAPNQNSTMTVSGPGASWTLNQSLTIGAASKGTLTIQDQGLVYVGDQLTITNQGVVNFFNGTLRFDTYSRAAGGLFNFYAGTIQLEGSRTVGTDPAISDLFGVTPILTAGKGLTIEGATTLLTTLLIDGGTFTAPSVAGGQNLQLRRGTLNLTSQSVTIGSGGLLGSALDLPSDMTVNVTQGISNQGLVTGDGQIGGTFTNAAAGELRGEPGKSLKLTGANNVNAGQINLFGGMVEFTQNLTNNSGALISGNGTLKVGTLTNSGTMNFSGLANIVGDVTNNAGAKIISSGGGPTTFHDDVINNGEIRTSAGSFTTFFGATSGSGTYTGTGTVNFEGDLKPGNSPAAISFAGNMALGVGAALTMEIAGFSAGSQYDQVSVAGNLALDGALQVLLINGFNPAAGNSFDLLNWNSLSGTFSSLNLPTLNSGLTWNTSQLYTSGVISVTSVGVPGDYNNNGTVDAADYVVWRKTGINGQQGYIDWRAHFGQTGTGSGAGATASAAVPEPSTLVLLMFAAIGWCLRRVRTA